MVSPFPVNTRVTLSMRLAKFESRAEGIVRVMHPEIGMGVEFRRTTDQQRNHLEKFMQGLKEQKALQPELLVEPDGMIDPEPESKPHGVNEDPLLELFQRDPDLSAESFLTELRKHRNSTSLRVEAAASI